MSVCSVLRRVENEAELARPEGLEAARRRLGSGGCWRWREAWKGLPTLY